MTKEFAAKLFGVILTKWNYLATSRAFAPAGVFPDKEAKAFQVELRECAEVVNHPNFLKVAEIMESIPANDYGKQFEVLEMLREAFGKK